MRLIAVLHYTLLRPNPQELEDQNFGLQTGLVSIHSIWLNDTVAKKMSRFSTEN